MKAKKNGNKGFWKSYMLLANVPLFFSMNIYHNISPQLAIGFKDKNIVKTASTHCWLEKQRVLCQSILNGLVLAFNHTSKYAEYKDTVLRRI